VSASVPLDPYKADCGESIRKEYPKKVIVTPIRPSGSGAEHSGLSILSRLQ
jgi:hypothetical protein